MSIEDEEVALLHGASRAVLGHAASGEPRVRLRLTHEVVETVADQIIGGQLPSRTLLPSEAAMGASFGVSRTVIRESLRVLENMGLVTKRHGKVSWTAPEEAWNLLDPVVLACRLRHDPGLGFLDDLVTVRASLESEMARQAATRATGHEVEEIAGRLAELEQLLGDTERYKRTELHFHEAVMRASRNHLARAVVTAIHVPARASAEYAETETPLELVRHSHAGHVAVLKAIRGRDPAAAAQAMREHVRTAWEWRQHEAPTRAGGRGGGNGSSRTRPRRTPGSSSSRSTVKAPDPPPARSSKR